MLLWQGSRGIFRSIDCWSSNRYIDGRLFYHFRGDYMEKHRMARWMPSWLSWRGSLPYFGLPFAVTWVTYVLLLLAGIEIEIVAPVFSAGIGLVLTALLAAYRQGAQFTMYATCGSLECIAAGLAVLGFKQGISLATVGILFGAGDLLLLSSLAMMSGRKFHGISYQDSMAAISRLNLQTATIGLCYWLSDLRYVFGIGIIYIFAVMVIIGTPEKKGVVSTRS